MIDTPQQPIDAVRWRETIEAHGAIRHLVNTEPRPKVDPYPIGQRLFAGSDGLDQRIITNLYGQIEARGKG